MFGMHYAHAPHKVSGNSILLRLAKPADLGKWHVCFA